MPVYDLATQHAFGRLRLELPDNLYYHNFDHTVNEVLPAAVKLARLSGINSELGRLIAVAAAYHDIGFIYQSEGHEISSARVAAQTLPNFDFDDTQIDLVLGMIMATRLPQSPRNRHEAILADADLDVLGRQDFFERTELLHREMIASGQAITREEWTESQIHFFVDHSYFTEVARNLRDAGKKRNLAKLEEELRSIRGE